MIEKNEPYSDAVWQKLLVEQGWTGLIFAEEDGGQGLGMVEMAVAFEEMGRALLPGAFLSTVALAGSLIAEGLFPGISYQAAASDLRRQSKATVALLEESANWDPDAVAMIATAVDGGFKLSGKKLFVSDAAVADCIVTVARGDSESRPRICGFNRPRRHHPADARLSTPVARYQRLSMLTST